MEVKFHCDKCDKDILINKNILHSDVSCEDESRQSILITYFDCPECEKTHFVQIDNGKTLSIKRDNIKMFRRLSKLRIDDKAIPKQQSEKFEKLREKLTKERQELMKQYENKVVTDTETGEKYLLSFTVL